MILETRSARSTDNYALDSYSSFAFLADKHLKHLSHMLKQSQYIKCKGEHTSLIIAYRVRNSLRITSTYTEENEAC